MPDVPQNQSAGLDDTSQQDLQGYQDDFDTSKKDQLANEAGDHPTDGAMATRSEMSEGLEKTATDERTGPHEDDAEHDDYESYIEDRDEEEGGAQQNFL